MIFFSHAIQSDCCCCSWFEIIVCSRMHPNNGCWESGLSNLVSVESMYDFLLLCNSEWFFCWWVESKFLVVQECKQWQLEKIHCFIACVLSMKQFSSCFVRSRVIVLAQGLVQVGATNGCRQLAIGKIAKFSLHWM